MDCKKIAAQINSHLPIYLEEKGYSYRNIKIYRDGQEIYHIQFEGIRYVLPNMNGGKPVI